MIAPGMKVAAPAAPAAPRNVALGVVTPDRTHVVWHEIIDHAERSANAYGGMKMSKIPKVLRADEVPCPPQFAHFIP